MLLLLLLWGMSGPELFLLIWAAGAAAELLEWLGAVEIRLW